MTKLLLLIGASVRTGLRWTRQHVYSWLILAPIVLGFSYASAARLAGRVELRALHPAALISLATLVELALIAVSMTRATSELYHLRRPESQLEALPVPFKTFLHSAWLIRLARTAIVAVALLVVLSRFEANSVKGARTAPPLLLFVALTATAEMLAALNWIHWGHKRDPLPALGAVLVICSTAVLAGLMLLEAAGVGAPGQGLLWPGLSLASVVMLYLLVRISHQRWRASDIEYARRLQPSGRGAFLVHFITRRFGSVIQAQLARDLLLTLRGFSSTVYVACAFGLLWPGVLASLLTTDTLPHSTEGVGLLDVTWLPAVMAIKIACALAVVSMAALLPVLVGHELPHFWLERAAGTNGLDMWHAKLWYARLVSAPAPVVVWMAGLLTGKAPMFYALPLLAECLWLWWLASSIIGALSFEMPARVGLSVILTVTAGLTAGVLSAMAWPVGLLIYAQAMHSLTERGRARARYYLMMGED